MAPEVLTSAVDSVPEWLVVVKDTFQVFVEDFVDKTPRLVNDGQF